MSCHLSPDYFEDTHGTFVSQPKKYIDKLAETYKRLFNDEPPKGLKTPLGNDNHPVLDTSEILDGDMAAKDLTMVGQLQWLITLGRFDLHTHIATMSRFRAAPRQGHVDRLKRIYAYAYSVYGNVHKVLHDNMPEPLGEAVVTTTTMDANLNHY